MIEKNVILVEEEKDSLLSVNLILKFNGYKVTIFKNHNEALDKILALEKASSFCELLITDIPVSRLANKDVVDKHSKLKNKFPIYVISDFVDKKILKEYEEKGFYLIEKPIELQDLLKHINKTLLEQKRRI